jgi:glycosyltransferase involved in cell wall biosynthesis/predicted O-methyltransferase YrrM
MEPIKSIKKIEGWLSEEEAILLYRLAEKVTGRGAIVEIGAYKGKSTVCLAKGSKKNSKIKIYSIDHHKNNPPSLPKFKSNLKKAGVEKLVVPIIQTSEEAAKSFDKPVELIFIDGNHDYEFVKRDFELWFPKLIDGGIIVFHDYYDKQIWPGVKKAIGEINSNYPELVKIESSVKNIFIAKKMKEPLVSIIIPAYNSEKTLMPCISSILNQDYKNFELILVDNNSTDSTRAIIKEFQKKDPRIKCFTEKEQKRGAARNTGERLAKGEIVLMTDSDCIVHSDWINQMIIPILKKECEAVQGSEEPLVDDFWSQQIMLREKMKLKNSPLGNVDTKNFVISKEALKRIGFTSRNYFSGNDTELGIRIQKDNIRLKFVEKIKVRHKNESSAKAIIKKYFYRAKWCVIIGKDNKDYLNRTKFFSETNQTLLSFFKFFPEWFMVLIKRGIKYAYFDLITGMAWRFGLISGKMTKD